MRRREFIAGLGGAAAWPVVTHAQQSGAVRRVGMLIPGVATDALTQSRTAAFAQGMRELGWIEGQNLHVDVRWSANDATLARIYAAQLIGLMPDVILAHSTYNLIAVREATSTVPVVFVRIADPVAQGFVASMRQPGGNLTGFSVHEFAIGGKLLGLLKEVVPGLTRVAVLFNPDLSLPSKFLMQAIEAVAPTLGVQATVMSVRATTDIEPALQSFARQPNGGLILTSDNFVYSRFALIVDQAHRYRLPSIALSINFAKQGGLMEYNVDDLIDQFRQAAGYVDRILKGAKPGDLPVQAPTKYRLAINLKAAKALGLTVPPTLLAVADEVIE
jgi:putative tryptophan/tyrosine transport system substrate-binding protein